MSKNAVLTEYEIYKEGLKKPLVIGLVTDLHERKNDDSLALLKELQPDIIAVAGDTFERYSENHIKRKSKNSVLKAVAFNAAFYADIAIKFLFRIKNLPDPENSYRFLSEAAKLAPVFMSLGNHEEELTAEDYKFFERVGITLLDNSDAVFEHGGDRLLIGGLSTFYDEAWLSGFSKKRGFKLLLSHHPEYFDELIADKNIDLTLSGHNHGGQIRLFGRGVLSSSSGLFPRYDKGVFHNRLAVSAGCANTVAIPRFNNPREVVAVRVFPKK